VFRKDILVRETFRQKVDGLLLYITSGTRSFAIAGPKLWNVLPSNIRDRLLSLTEFKAQLKTFLFRRA